MISNNPISITRYLPCSKEESRLMFLFMWTINVLVVRRKPDYLASRTINDHDAISKFKTYLSDCFHMKDLGVLKYFLGVEVARSLKGYRHLVGRLIYLCFTRLKLSYSVHVLSQFIQHP